MDITLSLNNDASANLPVAFFEVNAERTRRGQVPYPSFEAYLAQEITDIVASYAAFKTAQRVADPKAKKITDAFAKASDADFQAYLDAAAKALNVDISAAAEAADIKIP